MTARTLIYLVLIVQMVFSTPCFGQFGAEAPVLGKSTFGINGIAVIDAVTPTEFSYNPALIAKSMDIGQKQQYLEFDRGIINFSQGPTVTNGWQYITSKLNKNSAIRLAHYNIRSDSRPIVFTGPQIEVRFTGDTYELVYGEQTTDSFSWGVALVPNERVDAKISTAGTWLASANAKTTLHFRLGVGYAWNNFIVGLVYAFDRFDANTYLSPISTGAPNVTTLSTDFKEELWTSGISWEPRLGTILNINWQRGKINGIDFNNCFDLKGYNVIQFLNEKVMIQLGINDNAPSISMSYFDQGWTVGASFTQDAYRKAEDYLGRADTYYLWLGKSL